MALEGQHIVRVLVPNRLRHVLLRPHGVDRHETAGSFQQLESGGDSRDLVTLLLDGHVSQDSACRGGPRTHHVERTAINRTVKTMACGLAIDGHHVAGERPHDSLLDLRKPSGKAGPKSLRLQSRKHPRTRLVGRNPMGQREQTLPPRLLGVPVFLNSHPGIRSTHNGTHSDHHDIYQSGAFWSDPRMGRVTAHNAQQVV